MDRYQRVEKPKAETPINENEIRITTQGRMRNYITYATTLLQQKGSNEIVLKAMGRAINKTVMIAELVKRRIVGLHENTSIGSMDITDIWEPLEEGLLPLETIRHVSIITITLSKKELDKSSTGYQPPIPADLVKPSNDSDQEEEGLPGTRGRGRGGQGRGPGRGNYNGTGDYNGTGWDDGHVYGGRGRGRGRIRNFRGRGRGYGKYSGGYYNNYIEGDVPPALGHGWVIVRHILANLSDWSCMARTWQVKGPWYRARCRSIWSSSTICLLKVLEFAVFFFVFFVRGKESKGGDKTVIHKLMPSSPLFSMNNGCL
ncbi:hypothetical protein Ancab_026762 [Ancistrocladus abbreviatus]